MRLVVAARLGLRVGHEDVAVDLLDPERREPEHEGRNGSVNAPGETIGFHDPSNMSTRPLWKSVA